MQGWHTPCLPDPLALYQVPTACFFATALQLPCKCTGKCMSLRRQAYHPGIFSVHPSTSPHLTYLSKYNSCSLLAFMPVLCRIFNNSESFFCLRWWPR